MDNGATVLVSQCRPDRRGAWRRTKPQEGKQIDGERIRTGRRCHVLTVQSVPAALISLRRICNPPGGSSSTQVSEVPLSNRTHELRASLQRLKLPPGRTAPRRKSERLF